MATLREDLLTVAGAAFAIRCDHATYDAETRECAWDLWCLALELLSRHERRLAAHGVTPPIEVGAERSQSVASARSRTPLRLAVAARGGEA